MNMTDKFAIHPRWPLKRQPTLSAIVGPDVRSIAFLMTPGLFFRWFFERSLLASTFPALITFVKQQQTVSSIISSIICHHDRYMKRNDLQLKSRRRLMMTQLKRFSNPNNLINTNRRIEVIKNKRQRVRKGPDITKKDIRVRPRRLPLTRVRSMGVTISKQRFLQLLLTRNIKNGLGFNRNNATGRNVSTVLHRNVPSLVR